MSNGLCFSNGFHSLLRLARHLAPLACWAGFWTANLSHMETGWLTLESLQHLYSFLLLFHWLGCRVHWQLSHFPRLHNHLKCKGLIIKVNGLVKNWDVYPFGWVPSQDQEVEQIPHLQEHLERSLSLRQYRFYLGHRSTHAALYISLLKLQSVNYKWRRFISVSRWSPYLLVHSWNKMFE